MTNQGDDNTLAYFIEEGTGDFPDRERAKLKHCSFGKYTVSVVLDDDDRFIGIASVAVDQTFLSREQRRLFGGVHDVSLYYEDER